MVKDQVQEIHTKLESTNNKTSEIGKTLIEAGASWVEDEPLTYRVE